MIALFHAIKNFKTEEKLCPVSQFGFVEMHEYVISVF